MKRYDSYKGSGVEWIGEIPSHWKLKKIKHHSDVNVGLVINPSTYYDDNGEIPIITGKMFRLMVLIFPKLIESHLIPTNCCTKLKSTQVI